MNDEGKVHSLKALGHQPSQGLLDLADRLELHARHIREGKIIAGAVVTIGADNSEVSTDVNYDARGVTLLGGVRLLGGKLTKMLD